MIVGIVGSRRRKSIEDLRILEIKFNDIGGDLKDVTIVTGDCDEGGDFFAIYLSQIYKCKLDVKHIRDPETNEPMDFKNHRWFNYFTMCNIYYKRDKEIAKEPLDYLIALVAPDRTGGTEYTIKQFKKFHKRDWDEKLIIL